MTEQKYKLSADDSETGGSKKGAGQSSSGFLEFLRTHKYPVYVLNVLMLVYFINSCDT